MKILKLIPVGAALLASPAAFADGPEGHTPPQIASYVEPEGQTPAQVASYVLLDGQTPTQIASYRVREEK